MKIAVFSIKEYEKELFLRENDTAHLELVFFETALCEKTAILAQGFDGVCCFVTDTLNAKTLALLHASGVRLIALRSAGFNHVDVPCAKQLGMIVVRVPNYSPYAIAEFAVGLLLTLNRKIHRAYQLVREHNFMLNHLLGFDLHGKTVGVVGAGRIGSIFVRILCGFGCRVLIYDKIEEPNCLQLGATYVPFKTLLKESDIISLHCPLNETTHHLIDSKAIAHMKRGVMLINTGRGGLIDTKAVIQGLKEGTIGYLGLDVYEEEEHIFFKDRSEEIINDDVFLRLQTFPNVVITSHQAFFTKEAIENIIHTTLCNIKNFATDPNALGENRVS
jgi:D-lactate dehydrogenase